VLVLPGRRKAPVHDTITIGRCDHATTKRDDQTVSRLQWAKRC
jgi:hypothetical protein